MLPRLPSSLVQQRQVPRNLGAIIAARERTMAERLELAISWNKVASELRAGMIRLNEEAARRQGSAPA